MDEIHQELGNEANGDNTGDSQPSMCLALYGQQTPMIQLQGDSTDTQTHLSEGAEHLSNVLPEGPYTPSKTIPSSLLANNGPSTGATSRFGIEHLNSPDIFDPDNASLRSGWTGSTTGQESTQDDRDMPPISSPLDDALRAATLDSIDKDGREFIPASELARIITWNSVYGELQRLRLGDEKRLSELADQIWGGPSSPVEKTRRKIFAILILAEKVKSIVGIIGEGRHVYDQDLPFVFSKQDSKVFRRGGSEAISIFRTWKPAVKDNFEAYQWLMLSPRFRFKCERLPTVNRYPVLDRAVLPYIAEASVSKQPSWNEGGFSIVRKVKFHHSHYNWEDFCTSEEDAPAFAVKTIKRSVDETALHNNEVESLIRLNMENEEHLIRLLVAFQHRGQLHLVFPWADGNLQDFWKKTYPSLNDPPRDCHLVRWMIKQCLGIAKGLQKIHNNSLTEAETKAQDLKPDTPQKRHGRHGDLKPENILWFRPQTSNLTDDGTTAKPLQAILRISDFGFADFYGTTSKSKMEKRGMTGTYRAPEWDMYEFVAPEYDLWCMGCIFLEFVEWYLCGAEGIDAFIDKRVSDSGFELSNYAEDSFFNCIQMKLNERRASAKKSVREEISLLREHDGCNDFLLDLLVYIEEHMLRMGPKKRASCNDLVEKLQEMFDQCMKDSKYCTLKTKTTCETKATALSELIHRLSPKLRQNSFGSVTTRNPGRRRERSDSEAASSTATKSSRRFSHRPERDSGPKFGLGVTMEPEDFTAEHPKEQTVAPQTNIHVSTGARTSDPGRSSLEKPKSISNRNGSGLTGADPPETSRPEAEHPEDENSKIGYVEFEHQDVEHPALERPDVDNPEVKNPRLDKSRPENSRPQNSRCEDPEVKLPKPEQPQTKPSESNVDVPTNAAPHTESEHLNTPSIPRQTQDTPSGVDVRENKRKYLRYLKRFRKGITWLWNLCVSCLKIDER